MVLVETKARVGTCFVLTLQGLTLLCMCTKAYSSYMPVVGSPIKALGDDALRLPRSSAWFSDKADELTNQQVNNPRALNCSLTRSTSSGVGVGVSLSSYFMPSSAHLLSPILWKGSTSTRSILLMGFR